MKRDGRWLLAAWLTCFSTKAGWQKNAISLMETLVDPGSPAIDPDIATPDQAHHKRAPALPDMPKKNTIQSAPRLGFINIQPARVSIQTCQKPPPFYMLYARSSLHSTGLM
jgi:hypothetical protein